MSANDLPDNSTLLFKELDIPGRTGPVSVRPMIVWGINLAAARDNFPRQGLLCRAGPWSAMGVGDKLTIFWGEGPHVHQEVIDKNEVGTELQMFVPAARINEGKFAVSYTVTRLNQTPEPSDMMEVLVKLTRPGGHDENDGPGHSKLIMSIPPEIIAGGIDQDNVVDGFLVTIGNADGSPPYPNAAAGDQIQVTCGGVFVLSERLTQDQAEGKTPTTVHVDEAAIREAGDSDERGLQVAFEVYDLVDNRSEDWSFEQRIVVAVDSTRLSAPLLKEAVNNVLDVDKLGNANGTAQIIAMDGSKFKVGDIIIVRIKGTPVEGAPIDVEIKGEPLVSLPSIPEISLPNALLVQMAKSQLAMSYRVKKADGSAELRAKTQFISAIGQIHRLAAPIALDAVQGALDPTLAQVRIEIAWNDSFGAGISLELILLGTRPDQTPYLPKLPLRIITDGDMAAKDPLRINIPGEPHLSTLEGGTAELYYRVHSEDAVLSKMNRVNATHAVRESIHADILQVGKPRLELPEPVVAGVVNGILPADTDGTTLTVPYQKTESGDEVTYKWIGSKTGTTSDSVKLNSLTAGKEVPFTIDEALIRGNVGGVVKANYSIKRLAGGTSDSDSLEFSVGVALDLKAPSIKQAPEGDSLDPFAAQDQLTAVIDYVGMRVGDELKATFMGAPGTPAGGSHTTAPMTVTTVGPQKIALLVGVLAFNLGKEVTVSYTVTLDGMSKDSEPLLLSVLPIADADPALGKPLIRQAANNGEGPEFDVSALTAAATVRVNSYPLIALKQPGWMRVEGTNTDGSAYARTLWQPPGGQTNITWINQGFWDHSIALAEMKNLKNGTGFKIQFKAGLSGSQVEREAVPFEERIYTVKSKVWLTPTLGNVLDDKAVEVTEGQITVSTSLKLKGTATEGEKVEIYDGSGATAELKGTADVQPVTGNWDYTITVPVGSRRLYAKALYPASQVLSNVRNLTVTLATAPTIDSVKGSPSGVEIPDNGSTVESAVTLTGTAAKGQKVRVFDGTTSKGEPVAGATTGVWTLPVTGLAYMKHSFTAKALYGTGQTSEARKLTVQFADTSDFTGYNYNGWSSNYPITIGVSNGVYYLKSAATGGPMLFKHYNGAGAGTYETSLTYRNSGTPNYGQNAIYIGREVAHLYPSGGSQWKTLKAQLSTSTENFLLQIIFAMESTEISNITVRKIS